MKTLPCVHMNGTSAQMLFDGYRRAYEACRDALHAIEESEFNARDYYPVHPNAWAEARAEMGMHVTHIAAARDAFLAVAAHVQEVAGDRLK